MMMMMMMKNWPEDGSLELKHVKKANYVLMIIYIYILCLTE